MSSKNRISLPLWTKDQVFWSLFLHRLYSNSFMKSVKIIFKTLLINCYFCINLTVSSLKPTFKHDLSSINYCAKRLKFIVVWVISSNFKILWRIYLARSLVFNKTRSRLNFLQCFGNFSLSYGQTSQLLLILIVIQTRIKSCKWFRFHYRSDFFFKFWYFCKA
jgi:hypothetical protein